MRVLLVPNTLNPAAVSATVELATWLEGQGFAPVLATNDAAGIGLTDYGVAPADIGELALVVSLGGDGTMLKAVHLLGEVEVPVLGIKFGRLGFLAGASADAMRDAVSTTLAGEARIERRATLRAEIMMEGRIVGSYRALNEVVVSRGESPRVIVLGVGIDGHKVARLRGDGIIVATATGSTAYALSAGGPIVAPGFGGMVVVPVAAHSLNARPLVTDAHDVIEITMPDVTRANACVIVDGEVMPCRRALDRVTVTRGTHDVLLAKLDGRSFYDTVAAEFFGG